LGFSFLASRGDFAFSSLPVVLEFRLGSLGGAKDGATEMDYFIFSFPKVLTRIGAHDKHEKNP